MLTLTQLFILLQVILPFMTAFPDIHDQSLQFESCYSETFWFNICIGKSSQAQSVFKKFHLFIHSFIRSFIHSFICSSIRSFVHSSIHSCIRFLIHSFVHSFIHSFSDVKILSDII